MNIHFETTGCRLNQIESESAARTFLDHGFSVSMTPLSAKSSVDQSVVLCVINTCAVTQKAEQKDRRIIRLVLEKCPNATVVVTGCYAQLAKENIESMDCRIACLPGQLKSRISEVVLLLKEKLSSDFCAKDFAFLLSKTIFAVKPKKQDISENAFLLSTDSFTSHSRSSIKIQDGCNNACSFCTIHIARGHSVSLDAKKVIERVKALENAGQNEIVFTTVNIAQYKSEYEGKIINFTELLSLCLLNTKNVAFRISSLYPELVDESFANVIKDSRVRPHFHLSVQSGSDKVLKQMNRIYSSAEVKNAVTLLRKAKENAFIAADIITGFPGETEEDFYETVKLCKECNFSWIHIFPFSARKGTPAATMKNQVPQSTSGERSKSLLEIARKNKEEYIKNCIGKTFSAIMENSRNGKFHALTENFLHCIVLPKENMPKSGEAIKVFIKSIIQDGIKKGGNAECECELED